MWLESSLTFLFSWLLDYLPLEAGISSSTLTVLKDLGRQADSMIGEIARDLEVNQLEK